MVSRLTWQKGINLVLEAAELVLQKGASVVIVGSGEYGYEQEFEDFVLDIQIQWLSILAITIN